MSRFCWDFEETQFSCGGFGGSFRKIEGLRVGRIWGLVSFKQVHLCLEDSSGSRSNRKRRRRVKLTSIVSGSCNSIEFQRRFALLLLALWGVYRRCGIPLAGNVDCFWPGFFSFGFDFACHLIEFGSEEHNQAMTGRLKILFVGGFTFRVGKAFISFTIWWECPWCKP